LLAVSKDSLGLRVDPGSTSRRCPRGLKHRVIDLGVDELQVFQWTLTRLVLRDGEQRALASSGSP
jgi:hypothetical protein